VEIHASKHTLFDISDNFGSGYAMLTARDNITMENEIGELRSRLSWANLDFHLLLSHYKGIRGLQEERPRYLQVQQEVEIGAGLQGIHNSMHQLKL
jgi:hypothetical protein